MIRPRRRLRDSGPALAAAALALALYCVAINGPYIYDDVQIIGTDTRIHSPNQWKLLWTKDYFNGGVDNLYRPLTSQTYAVQWWLNGDRPWAFRLINVLLHATVAAGVAELARRLAGLKAAYAAGLLFAVHPIHVEAVVGIVGRAEEMCTLFILGGLILFLRRPLTMARAMAIGLCGVAAMLSKEQGMLFPFLALALGLATSRRPGSPRERQAFMWLSLILSWSLAALIVAREELLGLKFEWDKVFLDISIQPLARSGAADRASMVFVLLGHYAQLMVAPVKLSIDYGMSVLSGNANPHDPYLYLGFATAIAGVIALIYALWRRQYAAAFCLIAAGLAYGMISNVVLIGTIFAERLMYLPSAFLLIWLAIYLSNWRLPAFIGLLAVFLILAATRTVTYAVRWDNRDRFYATSLAEQPLSIRLHELIAVSMMDRGDLAKAAAIAADGRRLAPGYWNIWVLSGQIAEKQGDLEQALAMYRQAFKCQPMVSLNQVMGRLNIEIRKAKAPATRPASTSDVP